MRKGNVESLLKKAQQQLLSIRAEYERSLQKQSVEADLKIDIKNLCENLRSVLDYVIHDIREKYCPTANPKDRFYFPILPDAKVFASTANSWFPGLNTASPAIWSILESIQPYQAGFQWLSQFNKLNNENKHGDLVEQTRKETQRVIVKNQGGGSVSWDPAAVKFGHGVFIGGVPVNPATQMPVPHQSQTVEKIIWVDFRFKDIDVSAFKLLDEAIKGITDISSRVYSAL